MKNIESHTITLPNGVSFKIYTDLADQVENAMINWLARTEDYTAKSFCKYINCKALHKAYTVREYLSIMARKS